MVFQTGNPVVPNYWSLDLTTGAEQSLGDAAPLPPGCCTRVSGPYQCMVVPASDGSMSKTLQIWPNPGSGPIAQIVDVVSYARCPGADENLLAFVNDASGKIVLEAGPFADPQPVALPIDVTQFGWWTIDQSANTTAATVWGASPSTPDQIGVYAIDVTSYAVTTDIPAVPASAAWAPGATPSGSLQSSSVVGGPMSIIPFGGSYFLYPRLMSDGGTTMFAGPFAGGGAASELALFQVPAGIPLPSPSTGAPSQSATGIYYGPRRSGLASWQVVGPGANGQLVVWDDTNRQVSACPLPPGAHVSGVASPDGTKTLFLTPQQDPSYYQGSGPLMLVTQASAPGGSDACTVIASANIVTAGFSPDNQFLFWLLQPATGEPQLFFAASDGSGAQMIGPGVLENIHFVPSEAAELEMILTARGGRLRSHAANSSGASQVESPIAGRLAG